MAILDYDGLQYYDSKIKVYTKDEIALSTDAMYNALPTNTIENVSTASFSDAVEGAPVKSLIVGINPRQAGSGDPSPTNIRAITGWTNEHIVNNDGINLCGGDVLFSAILSTGASDTRIKEDEDGRYYQCYSHQTANTATYIPRYFFKPNTQYTFVFALKSAAAISGSSVNTNVRIFYSDGTSSAFYTPEQNVKATIVAVSTAGKTVSRIGGYYTNAVDAKLYVDESGVFEGVKTIDDFVPSNGIMYDIGFPSEAGTVYGGTLDVTNGILKVYRDYAVAQANGTLVNSAGNSLAVSGNTAGNDIIVSIGSPGTCVSSSGICNMYKHATMSEGKDQCVAVYSNSSYSRLYVRDTSIEGWTEAANNPQLAAVFRSYLATQYALGNIFFATWETVEPVIYQLTPTQVRTLLGLNNVWAYTGDISKIEYRMNSVSLKQLDNLEEQLDEDIYNSYPIGASSGPAVSFSDGADGIPLKLLTAHIRPMQSGEGDPSTENVRPIIGWSKVTAQRAGKNLKGGEALKEQIIRYIPGANVNIQNKTVSIAANATAVANVGGIFDIQFKENTRYTIVLAIDNSNGSGVNLRVNYTDGSYATFNPLSDMNVKETKILVTASGKTVLSVSKRNSSGTNHLYYEESGIFEGVHTIDDFEPYIGDVYDIEFPDEVGEVYGGTLDVTSGKLIVNMVKKTFDGTENINRIYSGENTAFQYKLGSYRTVTFAAETKLCSHYKIEPLSSSNTLVGFNIVNSSGYNGDFIYFRPDNVYDEQTQTVMTSADFKEILAGFYNSDTPCEVLYTLRTPIEYYLTPVEITTLLAYNNICVSTGYPGHIIDSDVIYRTDPTISAQKFESIYNMLAPVENGITASQAYDQGRYFLHGNQFCKAKVPIASGATFTLGTNYEVTTVANELFTALS